MKLDNFIVKIRTLPVIEGASVTDTKARLLLCPYEMERRNHAWQFKGQLVATMGKITRKSGDWESRILEERA